MKYKIKDCSVYGVKNPFMYFSGWIEAKFEYIDVRLDGKTIYSYELTTTLSKIKVFSIKTELKTNKMNCTFVFVAKENNGNETEIYTYKSTLCDRLMSKLTPRWLSEFAFNEFKKENKHTLKATDALSYNKWIKKYEKFSPVEKYSYNPLISIVMPVYNVPGKYLSKCIDSILNQTYQNFEICIADDCSKNEDTIATLKKYMEQDSRIKVLFREKNGHISEATNSALTLATGEFIGLMDNDDALMPHALNEVVRVLNENSDLDFIYSDEDKIDLQGNRSDPHFKADFAKDTLYGGNYICHFSVIRKSIVDKVGGFRKGYEGAQDFDLFIRIAEETNKFYHISKVLYHWRMIPGSTALDSKSKNYAGEAGKRALEDLFAKKGIKTNVSIMINTHYFVEYLLDNVPMIDIIMPITSLNKIIENNLSEMEKDMEYENFRFVFITKDVDGFKNRISKAFNKDNYLIISASDNIVFDINKHCENTSAELLLFLDEYSNIQTFNSLEIMAGYAKRNDIGVVGSKIMNEKGWTMDSCYFVVNKKLMHMHRPSFIGDFGIYGNLLVPFNYRIVEHECYMVDKSNLIEVNGFDESMDFRSASYDLCVRLFMNHKRNILVPHVEVMNSNITNMNEEKALDLIHKWDNQGFDVTKDLYYNVNFSNKSTHNLDK